MTSIKDLATAQVEFARAEAARTAAFEAATTAGWSERELTDLGLLGDTKKPRTKRGRRTRTDAPPATTPPPTPQNQTPDGHVSP